MLRRSVHTTAATSRVDPLIVTDGSAIDAGSHKVTLDGQLLMLTPAEYDILLLLARASGRVKTREQLLVEVAGRDFESFDRAIDVHISSLRRKLGDDPKAPRFIETVRGAGYRMRKPGMNLGNRISKNENPAPGAAEPGRPFRAAVVSDEGAI